MARKGNSRSGGPKKPKGPHGGSRRGAGRPKDPPRGLILTFPGTGPQQQAKGAAPPPKDFIPGTQVEWWMVIHYARAKASRKDIVAGLGIPKAVIDQPELLARINREIERGHALYRLDLLEALRIRAIVDGSVNTLLAHARETLRWDKHERKDDLPPDAEAAEAELDTLLRKVAKRQK